MVLLIRYKLVVAGDWTGSNWWGQTTRRGYAGHLTHTWLLYTLLWVSSVSQERGWKEKILGYTTKLTAWVFEEWNISLSKYNYSSYNVTFISEEIQDLWQNSLPLEIMEKSLECEDDFFIFFYHYANLFQRLTSEIPV